MTGFKHEQYLWNHMGTLYSGATVSFEGKRGLPFQVKFFRLSMAYAIDQEYHCPHMIP